MRKTLLCLTAAALFLAAHAPADPPEVLSALVTIYAPDDNEVHWTGYEWPMFGIWGAADIYGMPNPDFTVFLEVMGSQDGGETYTTQINYFGINVHNNSFWWMPPNGDEKQDWYDSCTPDAYGLCYVRIRVIGNPGVQGKEGSDTVYITLIDGDQDP